MIIRVSLPLTQDVETNNYSTSEDIATAFRGLGLSLSQNLDDTHQAAGKYKIEAGKRAGDIVEMYSQAHYRDLAIKNFAKDPDVSCAKEIIQSSIYFGTSGKRKTSFVVCRANEGEIALILINPSTRKGLKTLDENIGKILKMPFIDRASTFGRPIELHSLSKKSQLMTAILKERKLAKSFILNPVESGLLTFSLFIFVIAFSLRQSLSGVQSEDFTELQEVLSSFSNAWPFALVAFGTNLLIILIKHFTAKKEQIRWDKR